MTRLAPPVRSLAKLAFTAADALQPPFRGPRLLILHQVGAGHGYQLDMRIENFGALLDWLGHHARVVPLEEALAHALSPDADRFVVLTFDDGFQDIHRNAFPLLVELGLPFTVYLTTHPVESREPLTDRPNSTPLTWDEVNEMAASGLMTLGAHTHSHPDLRHCSPEEIEAELDTSDALIRDRTGIEPRHFAYPYGYWSAEADTRLRGRYESAVLGGTTGRGWGPDPFTAPRVPIQLSDTPFFIRRKIERGLRTEERIRRRLTGYDGP